MRIGACFLIAFLLRAAPGPVVIPTTPAGTVLGAWLDAFNSGDRTRLASYLAKYEPDHKAAAEQLMNFRDQTGGFSVIRIEKSDPLHLEALVKERDGTNYARLTLDVTGAESPVVKDLGLRVVPPPPDAPAVARLPFDQAIQKLDNEAAALASKDKFSGDVLVARDGQIVLQKAYGMADRTKHIPNTIRNAFSRRFHEQNVHCDLNTPTGRRRQNRTGCASRQIFTRLPE